MVVFSRNLLISPLLNSSNSVIFPPNGTHNYQSSADDIMHRFLIKSIFLLSVLFGWGIKENVAKDFRIENRVFVEGKKEADSRSLTIFHGGMVYDFLTEPPEITIFDNSSHHFVLLNLKNQEQSELSAEEVNAFIKKLNELAYKQKDPLGKFFSDPKFEELFDAATGELSLTSRWVTYRVVTEAPLDRATIARYRDFSDWYARLNSMLNPGSRPPMARLQVNDALARHQVVAEVHLTVTSVKNNTPQKTVLRSEHDFKMNITPSILEQIQNAEEARSKFKMVPFEKYRKNRQL